MANPQVVQIDELLSKSINLIRPSIRTLAFTGAGVSTESGIPAFRGDNGIWNKYDPRYIEIDYFLKNPTASWRIIKEIFYDHFSLARPNDAHISLAKLEHHNFIHSIVTQNIDHLHQQAGSKKVIEYHGSNHSLTCVRCNKSVEFTRDILTDIPPRCQACNGLLKPDFVFFGEPIPLQAQEGALFEAMQANIVLIIGTSGEVFPACELPRMAKQNSACIIEINTCPSRYTSSITDIFLQGRASEILTKLAKRLLGI